MMWPTAVILALCFCYSESFSIFRCGSDMAWLEHGDYEVVDRENNVINATCDAHYILEGTARRTCQTTGWSGTPPTCTDIDECASTEYPCHRNALCANTEGSFECRCEPGKFVGSGRKERKGCTRLRCITPQVANATMRWLYGGSTVAFKCHDLHTMSGRREITCRRYADGWRWSRNPPICQKDPMCKTPMPMDNGRLQPEKSLYKMNEKVFLNCNEGYSMEGPSTWTCSFGEKWEDQGRTVCKEMGFNLIGQTLRETVRRVNRNMNKPPVNKNARFNPDDKRGVDIGFLLDTSSSIKASDFRKGMELIKMLVRELHLNHNPNAELKPTGQKRVLLLTFANEVKVEFGLAESANWSLNQTLERLDAIIPGGGETNLRAGLLTLQSKMLCPIRDNEGRCVRSGDAVRVVFIMTDGSVTVDKSMETAVYGFTKQQMEVYIVGIGNDVHEDNLQQLKGNTYAQVFLLTDYDEVKKLADYVVDRRLDSEKCGRSIIEALPIYGRSPSDAWPWNAYLKVRNGSRDLYCGGALICKGWILTAAKCVRSRVTTIRIADVKVTLGKGGDDMKEGIKVRQIVVHPEYMSMFPHVNDLALLEIDDEEIQLSDSIRTVCMPNKQTIEFLYRQPWRRSYLYNAGWGVQDNDRRFPTYGMLHHEKTGAFLSNTACDLMLDTMVSNDPNHRDKLACIDKTVIKPGGAAVCYGDIGGPVVWRNATGTRTNQNIMKKNDAYLSAIITHNSDCNENGNYTVVTKLVQYIPWINNITASCNFIYGKKILSTN